MELDKNDIIEKVKSGKELAREEEIFYMVEVLGFSQEDAERMLYINENYSDEMVVD